MIKNLLLAIVCLFLLSDTYQSFGQNTEIIPLPEHPRPDFMREQWVNLTGWWNFKFDNQNVGESEKWISNPESLDKKNLLPFPWG